MMQNYYKLIKDDEVSENDIRQALELDRKCLKLSDEEQFDIEKCLNWNKNTGYKVYTMIKDPETDDVVGYINAVPVNDKGYEEIKAGKCADVYINDDDIVGFDCSPVEPKKYKLYFASVVVDQNHRPKGTVELTEAFLDKLIDWTKSNIIVEKMIADAVSPQGEKYCERLGMKEITKTNHDSTIYELELFPPKVTARTPKQKELYNVLMEKYKELEAKKSKEHI